jgi:hypothetical protein
MKEAKTPQTKKRLSLLKDCRNTYGENDKSSRTSIRWRKSWVNRTYRRDVKQSLGAGEDEGDVDALVDRADRLDRAQWKKCPDMPLGKILLLNKTSEILQQLRAIATEDRHWLDKLARYLCDRDLKSGRIAILVRCARALTIGHYLIDIDLTLDDLTLLQDFLHSQQPE